MVSEYRCRAASLALFEGFQVVYRYGNTTCYSFMYLYIIAYQTTELSLKPLTLLMDLLIFLVLIFLVGLKYSRFLLTCTTDLERGKSATLKDLGLTRVDIVSFLGLSTFWLSMWSLTLFKNVTICLSRAMCICLFASV